MKKLRVLTVVGTRPEIIRLSRVMAALDRHGDDRGGCGAGGEGRARLREVTSVLQQVELRRLKC